MPDLIWYGTCVGNPCVARAAEKLRDFAHARRGFHICDKRKVAVDGYVGDGGVVGDEQPQVGDYKHDRPTQRPKDEATRDV